MKVKKINKKRKRLSIKLLVTSILIILIIIILLILFLINLFGKKSVFTIDTHTDEVTKYQEKNQDEDYLVSGWVDIPGTTINMPILRARNVEFTFPETLEKYAWTLNDDDKLNDYMLVFGHNIMNLGIPKEDKSYTRFEELMNYIYPEYASEHEYIQITIDGEEHVYKVYSVSIISESTINTLSYYLTTDNFDKDKYLKLFEENNIYDFNIKVDKDDNILSLTTCTRMFSKNASYDILVNAVEIDKDSKTPKYSLKKTERYKMVEEKLKGDD